MDLKNAIDEFERLNGQSRDTVSAIGRVLSGEANPNDETGYQFTDRLLGKQHKTQYTYESLATIRLISHYIESIIDQASEFASNFRYANINVGIETYNLPVGTIYFEKSDILDTPHVIEIDLDPQHPDFDLFVGQSSDVDLSATLTEVINRAFDNSYFKGWPLLCELSGNSLAISQIETEAVTRDRLFYRDDVWTGIDNNMSILYSKNKLMRDLNLDTRRGILLCGPPGTGKTALTTTIINERDEDVTAFIVPPNVAAAALRQVYETAGKLGKAIVILEDIDMYLGDRGGNSSMALPEFLNILDGVSKYNDIVTIGTTNDPKVLDKAAIRSARFDVIIEVDFPNKVARRDILIKYLGNHGEGVDVDKLVSAIPEKVSGADIREMIRYTVLNFDELNTPNLLDTIKNGRWKPSDPVGFYI